jgi:hypothetical protein
LKKNKRKTNYAKLHILEILFANKYFYFKNKIHLYKKLKTIIDKSEKYLQKSNKYKITKNNYHLKEYFKTKSKRKMILI